MMNLLLGLVLTLPSQAAAPAAPRQDAAARQQKLAADWRANIEQAAKKRRAERAAWAERKRRARAEATLLYALELEHRARMAPYIAAQAARQADLELRVAEMGSRVQLERAWLGVARQRNLAYAYRTGAPLAVGPWGIQVYDGFTAP